MEWERCWPPLQYSLRIWAGKRSQVCRNGSQLDDRSGQIHLCYSSNQSVGRIFTATLRMNFPIHEFYRLVSTINIALHLQHSGTQWHWTILSKRVSSSKVTVAWQLAMKSTTWSTLKFCSQSSIPCVATWKSICSRQLVSGVQLLFLPFLHAMSKKIAWRQQSYNLFSSSLRLAQERVRKCCNRDRKTSLLWAFLTGLSCRCTPGERRLMVDGSWSWLTWYVGLYFSSIC